MMLSKIKPAQFKKRELLTYFFVFAIVFSDILGNGNLNLLYFFGLLLIFNNFRFKRTFLNDVGIYFVPFFIMVIVEMLFSTNYFSVLKLIVYCLKIFICTALLSFTKREFWNIDHLKLIKNICRLFALMLFLSLISVKYPVLWRLNDPYNSVSKTRLQFLYSEPSVLGLMCGVILIILVYYFIIGNKHLRKITIKVITILLIILVLTFSLSGILYTAVAISMLFILSFFKDIRHIPKRYYFYLTFGSLIVLAVLFTNNPISRRIFIISSGADSSFHFRWLVGVNALTETMNATNFHGMGIGNMNTEYGLSLLKSFGIDFKLANSFLYFLCENGVYGFFYIIYLFSLLFYKSIKSPSINKSLKVVLLFFVFISQIAGGYFTDPLMWIVYGIISS